MRNPDKYIRKAISTAINNMVVSGKTIPCVDFNITGSNQPLNYVDMTSQTKNEDKVNKCSSRWECSIMLDCITRYLSTGNIGSRVLLNDIEDAVLTRLNVIVLEGGFRVFTQEIESSTSTAINTNTEVMFRQLIRYRLIVDDLN